MFKTGTNWHFSLPLPPGNILSLPLPPENLYVPLPPLTFYLGHEENLKLPLARWFKTDTNWI